jgi:hypothetical protein
MAAIDEDLFTVERPPDVYCVVTPTRCQVASIWRPAKRKNIITMAAIDQYFPNARVVLLLAD